ncbi:nodulation protein NolW [Bradyrhizobium sp. CB3481]|uniref:nodulation protein NolW n=1 Tax=Bradyrhizobium sp. CB3481 TaxID=3039158 RepID=UPI0024B09FB9|nr:nodulation protein NolW [Bradyrhizobium sp. CB3481]WFU14719.1 nodulation protein NolW [Bradyrhizobium sp. CB3481]
MAEAFGAPLFLPSTPYSYTVRDQGLSAALQEFGNNLNIRVNISSEVKGRIRGRMPDLPPRQFLERFSYLYNLQWYYDGLVLYVSAANKAQSRFLVLNPISFDAFKSALNALNISDERYIVKPAPGEGLVFVSRSTRFIALVDQTLSGLVAEAQARPSGAVKGTVWIGVSCDPDRHTGCAITAPAFGTGKAGRCATPTSSTTGLPHIDRPSSWEQNK